MIKTVRMAILAAMAVFANASATSSTLAQSQPSAEALQAARELATATSASAIPELVRNLSNQVWPTVEASLRVKNPKLDEVTLTELRSEFERLQRNGITEALADTASIYARYFTAEELRSMLAFYRTPVGSKALRVMPQATADLFVSMAPRLQVLSAAVNYRFAAILQQRGYVP